MSLANSYEYTGVKIYEEFLQFRLGRIDWVDMVNRVAKSVDNALMQIIVKQIENAYGDQGIGANYTHKGTYSDAELIRVIQNVEAKTGQRVAIYGSAAALAKVRMESQALFSERDKEDIRNNGHVVINQTYLNVMETRKHYVERSGMKKTMSGKENILYRNDSK